MGKKKAKKGTPAVGTLVNMIILPVMAAGVIAAYAVVGTVGGLMATTVKPLKNASLRFGGVPKEEFVAPRD